MLIAPLRATRSPTSFGLKTATVANDSNVSTPVERFTGSRTKPIKSKMTPSTKNTEHEHEKCLGCLMASHSRPLQRRGDPTWVDSLIVRACLERIHDSAFHRNTPDIWIKEGRFLSKAFWCLIPGLRFTARAQVHRKATGIENLVAHLFTLL